MHGKKMCEELELYGCTGSLLWWQRRLASSGGRRSMVGRSEDEMGLICWDMTFRKEWRNYIFPFSFVQGECILALCTKCVIVGYFQPGSCLQNRSSSVHFSLLPFCLAAADGA